MTEPQTRPTPVDARGYVAALEHPRRRQEAEFLLTMMEEATGQPAVMWGPSIIGFGRYHYEYESGHSGDAACVGFSPRKSSISFYGLTGGPRSADLLPVLGKHRTGKACLYVNKLADVDLDVLRELIEAGYEHMSRDRTTAAPV